MTQSEEEGSEEEEEVTLLSLISHFLIRVEVGF
jgi:hypothetical protein